MSKPSSLLARILMDLDRARRNRRRPSRALARDLTLQTLVADLVAARTGAGMTQQEVATRMSTSKSTISRLESGRFARPTLNTIERYVRAVGARVEIRVRAMR
jgi:predicted transcriptional regulator